MREKNQFKVSDTEQNFNEIMEENFPKLRKDTSTQTIDKINKKTKGDKQK